MRELDREWKVRAVGRTKRALGAASTWTVKCYTLKVWKDTSKEAWKLSTPEPQSTTHVLLLPHRSPACVQPPAAYTTPADHLQGGKRGGERGAPHVARGVA